MKTKFEHGHTGLELVISPENLDERALITELITDNTKRLERRSKLRVLFDKDGSGNVLKIRIKQNVNIDWQVLTGFGFLPVKTYDEYKYGQDNNPCKLWRHKHKQLCLYGVGAFWVITRHVISSNTVFVRQMHSLNYFEMVDKNENILQKINKPRRLISTLDDMIELMSNKPSKDSSSIKKKKTR
ncbi:MAG: hypothetical protein LBB53_04385 [Prevotellaceae bacterium]|jgi:hypothetical protein|nr:hypothetical protein [Prevotellaceae bacterium]